MTILYMSSWITTGDIGDAITELPWFKETDFTTDFRSKVWKLVHFCYSVSFTKKMEKSLVYDHSMALRMPNTLKTAPCAFQKKGKWYIGFNYYR